jgi:hypothetical protein
MHEQIRITVQSPDEGQENAITWWMNEREPPLDGYSALLNNEPQPGKLSFSVNYSRASGRLIQWIGLAWERSTVLLNPGWRAALLVGLGFLLLGVFLATYLLIGNIGSARDSAASPPEPDTDQRVDLG